MKISLTVFGLVVFLFLLSCGGKKQEHSDHNTDSANEDGNQVLYNQVMDIHDEVMPKTEDLYNKSKALKTKLKEATSDDEKQQLQTRIAYLDSVNNMMMDWMHEFRPLPDSTNEETARSYYETHLEKVKKVKEAILTALEKEK
jgi:hypothetical protein